MTMTNASDFKLIKEVLDKYFSFMEEQGEYAYAATTEEIPKSMLDQTKEADGEGYSFWLPISSTFTDNEIIELENLYKHRLPESFKFFLKQRHFIELHLGQNADFFSLFPGRLKATYKEIIDRYYWTLIKRNYLPFANFGDWGVLCFNANIASSTCDYEIVILDHDDNYQKQELYSNNFLSMFELFDKELDETIMQVRENKRNNA
jgi:hypothetical protein